MKGSQAANLSLALVLVGTPVLYFGALCSLGDPAPGVAAERIVAAHFESMAMLIFGLAALVAAVWLSGYGFSAAPRRAATALLLFIAAVIGAWFL